MTSEDSNSDSSMDEAENPSPWTGKLNWLEEAKKLLEHDGNLEKTVLDKNLGTSSRSGFITCRSTSHAKKSSEP